MENPEPEQNLGECIRLECLNIQLRSKRWAQTENSSSETVQSTIKAGYLRHFILRNVPVSF